MKGKHYALALLVILVAVLTGCGSRGGEPNVAAIAEKNPLEEIRPDRIVYIPFYVPVDHRWYMMDEESLKAAFFDMIRIVNPKVSEEDVVGSRIFRSHSGTRCSA